MGESDPIEQAAAALQTTIGSDETELRSRMGNEAYDAYMRRSNCVADLHVLDSAAHLKASFWAALSFAVSTIAMLAVAWSIWAWVR